MFSNSSYEDIKSNKNNENNNNANENVNNDNVIEMNK